MDIQTIKSASGIEAWLVEEHSLPMLSLRFSFEGGSAHDPAMQQGIANFHASAVSAGAGFETTAEFHEGLDDLALNMGFGATKDALLGSLDVLSNVALEAAALMKKALLPPRFEGGVVNKTRDRICAGMVRSERDPSHIVRKRWDALVFAGHPYARAQMGETETLAALGPSDLLSYNRSLLARDGLKVVAVGDLTPETFSRLLDELFGELPLTGGIARPLPGLSPVRKETVVTEIMVPQSTVAFGMQASPVRDDDHAAEIVLNQIIGGGSLACRLMDEMRIKRGLVYSVATRVEVHRYASIVRGQLATRSQSVDDALEVLGVEFAKMAEGNITQAELDQSKEFILGSLHVACDTNGKIASLLAERAAHGFGADDPDMPERQISAVGLADAQRVAKRLFAPDQLLVSLVRAPAFADAKPREPALVAPAL